MDDFNLDEYLKKLKITPAVLVGQNNNAGNAASASSNNSGVAAKAAQTVNDKYGKNVVNTGTIKNPQTSYNYGTGNVGLAVVTTGNSGSTGGYSVTKDPYKNYRSTLDDLYNKVMGVEGYKAGTYTPGQYTAKYDTTGLQQQLQGYADAVSNYGDFSYDMNADAVYQQALENYMMMGNQAMVDATANAASLTGGHGNSYASQVGNQAYQQYITQAHNALPQYQQMAMDVWSAGLDKRLNQYNMGLQQLSNLMALEDQNFNQWLANEDALYKAFNVNEQNAYNEWASGLEQLLGQYDVTKDYYGTLQELAKASGGGGSSNKNNSTTITNMNTGQTVGQLTNDKLLDWIELLDKANTKK